jgi:hypothetical protein
VLWVGLQGGSVHDGNRHRPLVEALLAPVQPLTDPGRDLGFDGFQIRLTPRRCEQG